MHAMVVVVGIVTEVGGATSHAAVVSRDLGVLCVVGVGVLSAFEGQTVALDADTGELLAGKVPTVTSREDDDPDLHQLAEWACAEAGANTEAGLPDLLDTRSR